VVVIPSIDILSGRCVRLLRGDYARSTVYSQDPLEVAAGFAAAGATRLHLVDLDAARGSGDNRSSIEAIVHSAGIDVQVAGGVRTRDQVDAWLATGAAAVIMGTAAVREPEVFARSASGNAGRIFAALDVRNGDPAVKGWTQSEAVAIEDLVDRWNQLALAGIILTCIDRDGTLEGPDLDTLARIRGLTRLPVQYSGGISSVDDVRMVAAAGADGVILGRSLYEGRVSLAEALAL
jgi:phosphoribosylformimino-5-aminoimidazole carboxamide ribotide isomerase